MRGKITSSGFEHIFLSEIKKKKISGDSYDLSELKLFQKNCYLTKFPVSGLHNWLYFHTEESAQRANYLGHMRIIDLGTVSETIFVIFLNKRCSNVNIIFRKDTF